MRADDVEIERDVVLEEIAMRDDDPEDTLGDVFLSALFGAHPVGRPVIGSVDSISAMTRAQLHSFHVRRYTPERMVVAVAGNVDHDEVVGAGARALRPRTWCAAASPVPPRKGTGRVTGPADPARWSTATPSRPTCRWACGRRAGTGSIGGRCRCSTPRWAAA